MFEFKVKCPECGKVYKLGKGAHLVKKCKACDNKGLGDRIDKILSKRKDYLSEVAERVGQALKPLVKELYGKEPSKYADEFWADLSAVTSNIRSPLFETVVKTATGKAPKLPDVKPRVRKED